MKPLRLPSQGPAQAAEPQAVAAGVESDATGLLLAFMATGAEPQDLGQTLARTIGWRETMAAISQGLGHDPVFQIRAPAGVVDFATAKPGPARKEVCAALDRLGIHPLAVALGVLRNGTRETEWTGQNRVRGLAKRLGVDPVLINLTQDGALDCSSWHKYSEGWPKGLTVIANSLYYLGPWKKLPLPEGLVVAGDLNAQSSSIQTLPEGLRVGGVLQLFDCDQWDGKIPASAQIHKIIAHRLESHHGFGIGMTMPEYQHVKVIIDNLTMTGVPLSSAEWQAANTIMQERRGGQP